MTPIARWQAGQTTSYHCAYALALSYVAEGEPDGMVRHLVLECACQSFPDLQFDATVNDPIHEAIDDVIAGEPRRYPMDVNQGDDARHNED